MKTKRQIKREYSVGNIVCLRDSLGNISRGRIEKVTLRRYYVKDLSTCELESYHWYFKTLEPNYSTTGYDKHIDYFMSKD